MLDAEEADSAEVRFAPEQVLGLLDASVKTLKEVWQSGRKWESAESSRSSRNRTYLFVAMTRRLTLIVETEALKRRTCRRDYAAAGASTFALAGGVAPRSIGISPRGGGGRIRPRESAANTDSPHARKDSEIYMDARAPPG